MATLDEVDQKLGDLCAALKRFETQHAHESRLLKDEAKALKEVAQKLGTIALQAQAARIAAAIVPGPTRMLYITVAAFIGGFAAQFAIYEFHILPIR